MSIDLERRVRLLEERLGDLEQRHAAAEATLRVLAARLARKRKRKPKAKKVATP
jgi:uncharacterized coiled-coil protein SlyX